MKKIGVSLLATLSALLLGARPTTTTRRRWKRHGDGRHSRQRNGFDSRYWFGNRRQHARVSTVRADAMPVTDTGSTVQASEAGHCR